MFLTLTKTAIAIPIVGSSANTLLKGKFMFEWHIQYIDFESRYSDGRWIGLGPDSSFSITTFIPQFYYGIANFLTIRTTIPVLMQNREFGTSINSNGIGDGVLDIKYCLVKGNKRVPKISTFLGTRFPTGDSDAEIPLGDGSVDYIFGSLISKWFGVASVHNMVGYWLNGKDHEGKDVDDIFFYNLSLDYVLAGNWVMVNEIDGSITGKSGKKSIVGFCPGIQYKGIKGLVLEGAFKIPIFAKGGYRYSLAPFIGGFFVF